MEHGRENSTHLIRFDADKARAFKRAYHAALNAEQDQFEFAGVDWLVSYARYVCEYLEGKGLL